MAILKDSDQVNIKTKNPPLYKDIFGIWYQLQEKKEEGVTN